MAQNTQSQDDKLKNILKALNTDIAREVLNELNKQRPEGQKSQVNKQQLYKLITELSNLTNLEQLKQEIREKDDLIRLQEQFISNQKAYIINLETNQKSHIDLILASLTENSFENLKNIENNQNSQELIQIVKLRQEFQEQQNKFAEIIIKNENKMEEQANKTLDDREHQEKIVQQTEIVISKSQKFLEAAIHYSQQNAFNQLEQQNKDQILKSIKVIQSSQTILKKLKEILSDQILQLNNYANENLSLIKQIKQKNEEIKNFNKNNQEQQKKFQEDFEKLRQNLEKQADDKIKQILQNQQLYNHIAKKFQTFQDGLKTIVKGIIEQQTYFLKQDYQIIRQSIQPGDLQKLLKSRVPTNITELQQQLVQMREYHILDPAKEQLKSFGVFAKNLEDQINKFLI